jgi:hypothetical protein
MAVLLQFDYNKRLGLPAYSSHSFGITMKAEVTDPDSWNCTIRQRALILSILERNDLDPEVVEDLSQELHGRPMSDLGKAQVSEVIGQVLDRWGRHPKTNGRTAGGRS